MPRSLSDKYRLGAKPQARICDHPDCAEAGDYRAPRSHEALRDYYWFCLTHVREYNANWNYCKGLAPDMMDRLAREDACWGRPTWPMGSKGGPSRAQPDFDDPFEVFEEIRRDRQQTSGKSRKSSVDHPTMEALDLLGLQEPLTMEALKVRYKALVKELHPDVNGQNKAAEDRLKAINHAYTMLKKNLMQNPVSEAM